MKLNETHDECVTSKSQKVFFPNLSVRVQNESTFPALFIQLLSQRHTIVTTVQICEEKMQCNAKMALFSSARGPQQSV